MIDIDCLGGNNFLKMLYPDGLNPIVMIKDITISVNGTSQFSFFVRQQPSIEVKKWGVWIDDFNALWIKTANYCKFTDINIQNLQLMGYNTLHLSKTKNGNVKIMSSKDNSKCEITLSLHDRFIIQEIIPIKT